MKTSQIPYSSCSVTIHMPTINNMLVEFEVLTLPLGIKVARLVKRQLYWILDPCDDVIEECVDSYDNF